MRAALTVLSLTIVFGAPAAHAQYTAKEWPEGPSKARFAATCDGCHDINRIRVGYTAEGWLSVVRMMQNVNAPVPAEEWGAMTDYLIKNFPERSRPPAARPSPRRPSASSSPSTRRAPVTRWLPGSCSAARSRTRRAAGWMRPHGAWRA